MNSYELQMSHSCIFHLCVLAACFASCKSQTLHRLNDIDPLTAPVFNYYVIETL